MGRDLATLCCTMPEFRVGYLGRGLGQMRKLPFMLYDYPESGQWGETVIQHAWDDFSGGENGIIMTLDDISRRTWFADPIGLPRDLQEFLGPHRNFQKWGYFPVDSTGPDGKTLSYRSHAALGQYDRVLGASEWSVSVLSPSCTEVDWMPHGIFGEKFYPVFGARDMVGGPEIWVGCVMANQSRKDFPVMCDCFTLLKKHYKNTIKFWIHMDEQIRYWNLPALLWDYGLTPYVTVTQNLSDEQLALWYSACACTILPSAGEGFGYPIAESLACGTACIVTDYAAGPELVSDLCAVPPTAYRVDTVHNCLRAVLFSPTFVEAAITQIDKKLNDWEHRAKELAASVEHLDWTKLQVQWKKWLLRGLK
jgi:glycosyltransferase involved in cell wall biosynthesis